MTDKPATATTGRSQSPAAVISREMVRLMARYLGRGPTKARTTLNSNLVAVVFADTLTRAEQNLTAAGQADAVRSMRQTLQQSMRDEAVATIEETLGRSVTGYMGDVDTEANAAALLFILESVTESGTVQVAEVDTSHGLSHDSEPLELRGHPSDSS